MNRREFPACTAASILLPAAGYLHSYQPKPGLLNHAWGHN